jgi:hypothetical protein
MNGASVLRPRRPASRLVSGSVAALALAIAIAASVWHQRPALAQTSAVTAASASVPSAADRDPSVPPASQVFTGNSGAEAPMVDVPTF